MSKRVLGFINTGGVLREAFCTLALALFSFATADTTVYEQAILDAVRKLIGNLLTWGYAT